MLRAKLIEMVAARVAALTPPHPVRVGIDGIDASGKTTFADELAQLLSELGRPTIRASIDGFHNPSTVRYTRGSDSPEGYFLDSFNHEALAETLLRPLGPEGSQMFRRSMFDFRTDQVVEMPFEIAAPNAILLFDGVFLHRPELVHFWDFSIFLAVDFETAVNRAELRDTALLGSAANVRARYARRYVPGQQLYLATCDPQGSASLIIENTDPSHPFFVDARDGSTSAPRRGPASESRKS